MKSKERIQEQIKRIEENTAKELTIIKNSEIYSEERRREALDIISGNNVIVGWLRWVITK